MAPHLEIAAQMAYLSSMLHGIVIAGSGIGAGLWVGGDAVGWLVGLWYSYVLPAFMEINASGLPLCV